MGGVGWGGGEEVGWSGGARLGLRRPCPGLGLNRGARPTGAGAGAGSGRDCGLGRVLGAGPGLVLGFALGRGGPMPNRLDNYPKSARNAIIPSG